MVDTPAPGRCFLEEGVTFANGSVVGSFALQCRGSDGKEFGGMQTVCIDGQVPIVAH